MEDSDRKTCPSCGLEEMYEDGLGVRRCDACGHVETDDSLPENSLGRNPLS